MDFVDILSKRIEGENELKRPVNALVCFSNLQTGKALGALIHKIVRHKADNSAITLLNLVKEEQHQQIENEEVYKSELLSDIIQESEKGKISVRTFVRQYKNFVEEILHTAEEYDSSLVVLGMESQTFDTSFWDKFWHMKFENEPNTEEDEEEVLEKAEESATDPMQDVYTLLYRNKVSTGIFVENNYTDAKKVFVPILTKEDSVSFSYLYQLAKNPDVKVMVWDAIGLIQRDESVQKLFQFIQRKTDGRVYLWDNDKKIEESFIQLQDLVIIGIGGWGKLICSAISWKSSLPSVLIIKDKQIHQ